MTRSLKYCAAHDSRGRIVHASNPRFPRFSRIAAPPLLHAAGERLRDEVELQREALERQREELALQLEEEARQHDERMAVLREKLSKFA